VRHVSRGRNAVRRQFRGDVLAERTVGGASAMQEYLHRRIVRRHVRARDDAVFGHYRRRDLQPVWPVGSRDNLHESGVRRRRLRGQVHARRPAMLRDERRRSLREQRAIRSAHALHEQSVRRRRLRGQLLARCDAVLQHYGRRGLQLDRRMGHGNGVCGGVLQRRGPVRQLLERRQDMLEQRRGDVQRQRRLWHREPMQQPDMSLGALHRDVRPEPDPVQRRHGPGDVQRPWSLGGGEPLHRQGVRHHRVCCHVRRLMLAWCDYVLR
jgi:hypothetical protein